MNRYLFALPLLMFVIGCNPNDSKGIKGAKGETPVKYILCGAAETDCFIAARFKDVDDCEHHKKWSEMLCDNLSESGKMTCEINPKPQIVFSYCTL